MALTFYCNGSSLTPLRNPSPWTNVWSPINVAPVQSASVETGNISGGIIDLDHSAYGYNGIVFPAKGAVSTSNIMSMLIRCSFQTVGSNQPLIAVTGPNLLGGARM